jgi:hypothetical protein
MPVLHNNANRDFMHLIWKIYHYELVTGMEKRASENTGYSFTLICV